MAALMIHETMMLAIGVMTHNHDPGIKDAGHHAALVLSKDCALYSTCIALFLLCMQCVGTHSFSSSSNATNRATGYHDPCHLV